MSRAKAEELGAPIAAAGGGVLLVHARRADTCQVPELGHGV